MEREPIKGVFIYGGEFPDKEMTLEELEARSICSHAIEYLFKKYGSAESAAIRILLNLYRKL